MSRRRPRVDATTRERQRRASDPKGSAWVAANAGSGKTFVLAQRVIRLLLAGTPPGRILCLTFTKAAAAQMAKRVFDRLAEWTHADEESLAEAIEDIEGARPEAPRLVTARRLFAEALETPGGLKIQTIHAFAEGLLHQFPFEAEVAGHFEVIDDRASAHLLAEARRQTLAAAAADPGGMGEALKTAIAAAGEFRFGEGLAEFIARRDRLNRFLVASGDMENAIDRLGRELGHDGEASLALRRRVWSEAALGPSDIERLAATLARGGVNDVRAAERIAACRKTTDDTDRAEAYLGYFTREDGEFRAIGSLASARVRALWAGLDDLLNAELVRLAALQDRIRVAQCFEASAAMLRLASSVARAYDREKARRGLLDFDDLVVKAAGLLSRADAADWVRFRLDQGLDHILIDEAQDTSPRQWELVSALAEEFFSGAGARPQTRTLFAVGDEKQSIYSFQGADPALFATHRQHFRARAVQAGLAWSDLRLGLSFRSTNAVLSAVDAVFGDPAVQSGVVASEDWEPHQASRRHDPGLVAVWAPLRAEDASAPEDWQAPLDQLTLTSPEVRLAERIAGTIKAWLEVGAKLDTGAPIRAGGILILTRKRGAAFEATNRAIKRAGLPVAGADRLTLTEHIAVQDLLALGEAVLLPDDDLALAALLKSPLVCLDEDHLAALAVGRKGPLRRVMAEATDPSIAAAWQRISAWRARADFASPHAFYAAILGPERGRRDFQRRLGGEAEEVLDEFLAEALAYEQVETPSLQGFIAWMKGAATEVKRDADLERDEVRVMTVHGAKGLEADIVFLIDDGSRPVVHAHDPKMLSLDDEAAAATGPVVWNIGSNRPPPVERRLKAVRERAMEEYRRLLYVGLTRARDRLYVAGIAKRHTDPTNGWHALVWKALGRSGTILGEGDEAVLEWRTAQPADPPAEQLLMQLTPPEPDLPAWIDRPAPSAKGAEDVAPSRAAPLIGAMNWARRRGANRQAAKDERATLERGRIVHRLLEALPEVAPAERRAVGSRFLETVATTWPKAEREAALGEVLAVLAHPDFAPVFAAGSRAEVDFVAKGADRGDTPRVAGRIDRIAVGADAVILVDYKTNRPYPTAVADVPDAYLAQLRSYADALAVLYPKKSILAGLLWTGGPLLMPIPTARLRGETQGPESA